MSQEHPDSPLAEFARHSRSLDCVSSGVGILIDGRHPPECVHLTPAIDDKGPYLNFLVIAKDTSLHANLTPQDAIKLARHILKITGQETRTQKGPDQ